MNVEKAQVIANELEDELGFFLVSYQNKDLEYLKDKLEEFLELEISTDELEDPENASLDEPDEDYEEDESD